MKKIIAFSTIFLLVLSFFACNFEIPSAVEIKGNPEISLTGNFEIGKLFNDGINDRLVSALADNEFNMELVHCTATQYQTYLIYMELVDAHVEYCEDNGFEIISQGGITLPEGFDEDFFDNLIEYFQGQATYTLLKDEVLLEDTIEIPLADVGELLDGFELTDGKILLYISGKGDLLQYLAIELILNPDEAPEVKENIEGQPVDFINWNVEEGYHTYTGANAPHCEIPISLKDMPLGENLEISYKIYVPEGTTIDREDLEDDADILIEAVIWFPLNVRVPDSKLDGVTIDFSSFLNDGEEKSDSDLFGRDAPDSEFLMGEIIESLSLKIVLANSTGLFDPGTKLIVTSGEEGVNQISVADIDLGSNTINIAITKEIMDQINDPVNWPFVPDISIHFPAGTGLGVPRDFDLSISQFVFSAKISHRVEF